MKGQTKTQLLQREIGRRDYDRPTDFRARGSRACWKKSLTDENGPCGGVIAEATEDEAIVLGVPAGAMLCFEHAWMDDETVVLKDLITDEDRQRFRVGKEIDLVERSEDLKHEQKLIDREDGKWGGC